MNILTIISTLILVLFGLINGWIKGIDDAGNQSRGSLHRIPVVGHHLNRIRLIGWTMIAIVLICGAFNFYAADVQSKKLEDANAKLIRSNGFDRVKQSVIGSMRPAAELLQYSCIDQLAEAKDLLKTPNDYIVVKASLKDKSRFTAAAGLVISAAETIKQNALRYSDFPALEEVRGSYRATAEAKTDDEMTKAVRTLIYHHAYITLYSRTLGPLMMIKIDQECDRLADKISQAYEIGGLEEVKGDVFNEAFWKRFQTECLATCNNFTRPLYYDNFQNGRVLQENPNQTK